MFFVNNIVVCDGTWSESQREANDREEKETEESDREENEREESKGEMNETEERSLKKKIKSMIIKKEDSENVTKSKIFQIIDFFDTYQFTFKFKNFKRNIGD